LTAPGAFLLYAVICIAAFLFVKLVVPETKGKSLEEIESGWPAGGADSIP
jgi:SP family sugar porter-like MFS transporter